MGSKFSRDSLGALVNKGSKYDEREDEKGRVGQRTINLLSLPEESAVLWVLT